MTREEKILLHVNKEKWGVEIGPSHSPLAPRSQGFKVHVIDHASKEDLKKKYADHSNVDTTKIEDVDFIWHGQTYAQLTGKSNFYSWIIASHLIEHTPDLINFLNQCDELLTDYGVLSLAIPDGRFCFDHFRPITGISKVIDAHYNKNTIHTPGTAAEYFLNFSNKQALICWDNSIDGDYTLPFSTQDARQQMELIRDHKVYVDLHSWCFTPTSFRLIIRDLGDLGFISLKEVDFYPSSGCEFFITLGRHGKGYTENRLTALKQISSEILIAY
ncbi:MAG: hypothetical protein JST42_08175 [Bacteroidetes bacterium]|nr:hypothetical protein [Bacteroidota bacterium]